MIDCVFLLLIFFLVTASLKKPHMELPITLPSAEAAIKAKAPNEELIVSVDRAGNVYVDTAGIKSDAVRMGGSIKHDSVVSNERLHKLLQKVRETSPDARIRIDCDTNTSMKHVAKIVDLCQLYGLQKVGIRTKD
jgi:biopolymer transport protein ExbD